MPSGSACVEFAFSGDLSPGWRQVAAENWKVVPGDSWGLLYSDGWEQK